MTNAREKILSQIRHSLQRDELPEQKIKELKQRMLERPRGILPKLPDDLVSLFIEKATNVSAKIEKLNSLSEAPTKITTLLKNLNKQLTLRISANSILNNLSWHHYPEIVLNKGPAIESDDVSLTTCFCGVAETGTLVLLSSPESPTTLNFLPETHIVLLDEKNIVGHYEDAWDLIRTHHLSPRTINFITGPSRTGDIEQTIQMGIHGPKQLIILLYS